MSFKEYIFSKLTYIIVNLIFYCSSAMIFSIAGVPLVILFFVFLVWFVPLMSYMILMFFKERSFYNDIILLSDKLDKKYLLPEILKKPSYYEGKVLYECLKESNRNMHEYVNLYKNIHDEYREYIETWIHEVKTPISSLKLMIDNSEISEKESFMKEADRIEQYVTQALYYCRSNDVSNDYIPREFKIEDIVNECIRNNRRDFINKRIKVITDNLDVIAISDVKWIKFIINQIIINSIKYSKSKQAFVKIYVINSDEELKLIIEDNGIGIPKCDLNRVFDKGFTGENGRKYGKSTGIGLYLCKKLCDKLQHNISLYSEVNEGTKIIINLK